LAASKAAGDADLMTPTPVSEKLTPYPRRWLLMKTGARHPGHQDTGSLGAPESGDKVSGLGRKEAAIKANGG